MDQATHAKAERILTRLCVGRSIAGIGFVAEPVLTLGLYAASTIRDVGGPAEAFLRIESHVRAAGPRASADAAGRALSLEELAALAIGLKASPIVSVRLGYPSPDFTLTFQEGTTLHVEGHDTQFEPWSIAAGDWSLYALAADEVTGGVPHPALA